MKTVHGGLGSTGSRRVSWRIKAAGYLFLTLFLGSANVAAAETLDLSPGPIVRSTSSPSSTTESENTSESSDMMVIAAADMEINRRDLQTDSRLWDISSPVMSISGMKLAMEHTVRDQVETSMIRIDLFRDDACSMSIDSNNYLTVDIVNDLTAVGDGSGTREVTVNYNIDPSTIDSSRIITYSDGSPIVSFCTRFNLIDPSTNQVANSLDTVVAVRVDITEKFEILAILEDQEDKYGVEAFECDSANERITEPDVKRQGSVVRVCVRPDSFTRDFAVVMKSINQLKLIRGDVSDEIIAPDGVIKDLVQTQYRCTAGDPICSVITEVSNQFFYSRGTVKVQGVAWLQYADSSQGRRLIEVPFQVGLSNNKLKPEVTPFLPMWNHRQALEAGAYIGARDFNLTFEVEPSGTDWNASAFLCDGRNLPLQGSALTRARNQDDDIRVCVMPSPEARQWGVYVREISSFYFEQGKLTQFAIRPSAIQGNNTLYICNAGEPLCAFKIELEDEFFNNNLDVLGVGEVLLQYGTDPPTLPTSRRLQDSNTDPTVDAGFAGRSRVTLQFETDPTYVPPSELTWQEKADVWWHDTPLFLRILYVLAAVLGILILLCFLWAICCGNPFDKRKTAPAGQPRKVFIQPIFMRRRNKVNAREEDVVDEEWRAQERDVEHDWEAGPDDNGISASRRLENGQMPTVPETESTSFTTPTPGTNAFHESFARLEPDYSKLPKTRPSNRSSSSDLDALAMSPRRSKNGSIKSPKPKRRASVNMLEDGAANGSIKSPKPKRRASVNMLEDGAANGSIKSPKPKRRSSVNMQDDGTANGTIKSPKPKRRSSVNIQEDGTANGSIKSPKPKRRSSVNMQEDGTANGTIKSPKPKRRTSVKMQEDGAAGPPQTPPKTKSSGNSTASTGKSPQTKSSLNASASAGESAKPKRRSSVECLQDGAPTDSPKRNSSTTSPKPRRRSSVASTTSSTKSPKPSRNSSVNPDGTVTSTGHYPRAMKSLDDSVQFSTSSSRSPKPRRSKRAMESTANSRLPRRGSIASTEGSLRTPGGRPSTGMRIPASAPAGSRRVVAGAKLPDSLPL